MLITAKIEFVRCSFRVVEILRTHYTSFIHIRRLHPNPVLSNIETKTSPQVAHLLERPV
jgi:hypothetical protein